MNSLNALGNRQIASLQTDLAKMENGESGPSVQGTSLRVQAEMDGRAQANGPGGITTTLGALSRLIDDYDSMARKEMVTAAREKANT
jgi:Golgi SNAP receptor complex protein 2